MLIHLEYSKSFIGTPLYSDVEKMSTLKRSAMADGLLLKTVRQSPGLSLYELHNRLKWSIGKVDGSKDRLLASRKIAVTELNRNGRHVSLIYAKMPKPVSDISVPKTMLHPSNPAWTHESTFYALDSTNIGVSGERFPDWERFALFKARTKPICARNRVHLKIPKQFAVFYDLEHKHFTSTVAENRFLITIDGDIIARIPEKSH
jgi:hypothetical protein